MTALPGRIIINWRREAIFPAQALADSILMAAWLPLFLNARHITPERAVTACLLIILGALYLTRVMEALNIGATIQRLIMLIGLTALITLALNWTVFSVTRWANWAWLREPTQNARELVRYVPEIVIITLALTWLVWRGLQMAGKLISAIDAMRSFQAGIIVLALFVVVNIRQDGAFYIPTYFFAQLLAIGLARVEGLANERKGRRSPFDVWWLSTLVGATGLVVLAGGVVSVVVLGAGPERLVGWIGPILRLVLLPFALILLPLFALIGMIAEAFYHFLFEPFKLPGQLGQLLTRPPESNATSAMNPTLQRVFEYGIPLLAISIVIAIAVMVIWMSMRRRERTPNNEGEEHESIWSGRALLNKLRAQVQSRLARLRQWAEIAGRFGTEGLFAALTIRRIYAQMVRLATARGYPRPTAHTPYEHLGTLQQAFPGCEADLEQITEAYVGVHYGELPDHPQALAAIRAAFERVKATEIHDDQRIKGQGAKAPA